LSTVFKRFFIFLKKFCGGNKVLALKNDVRGTLRGERRTAYARTSSAPLCQHANARIARLAR
jgi:hypothetical protein